MTTSAAENQTCSNSCYMKATSDGAWANERAIDYSLPLLIIQLCLILFFSRIFAFILKPLRQPRVIAEIVGGIVLGTSCMGQIPGFTQAIFPPKSLTVLTTVANLGLLYFLFTIGLELDMRTIVRTGRQAMLIAAAGISVPFAMGIGTSFAARAILGIDSAYGPFLVFMGVAMSITAFPVLARILAERKLLTTDVGQMAMSAAAVNDVVAWILLALAIALSTPNASPSVVVWILLCGVAFVVFLFVVGRPFMAWVTHHVVDNEPMPEWIVAVTLVLVLICGFVTDAIGIHGIFGAFVFGLIIPKDGPFPALILEKIEDFTTIILLPLYFASSGLAVNFQSLNGGSSVALLFLVLATAIVGKIGGTLVAALLARLPLRKSLVLGILMNTKGLVELIVLNIGLSKNVINQEIYTIMVIMALVTTFMTTPLVMLLYEPARERLPHTTKVEQLAEEELRLLVCLQGMKNMPAMLNLMEVSRGTRRRPLRVFLMHLMELSERSSAIMMVTRVRKDGRPYWSKEAEREGRDQVVVTFQAYAQLSRVAVQPLTAISGFQDMHEDICTTAAEKRSNLIIMPYHRAMSPDGSFEASNTGFQQVTRRVLRAAPCSVAILVDRGFGGLHQMAPGNVAKSVAVIFFGGPDDREALTVARRIAEHPGVTLTVIRMKATKEAELGFAVMEETQQHLTGGATASGASHHHGAGAVASAAAHGLIGAFHSATGRIDETAQKSVSFIVSMDKVEVDREAMLDDVALAPVITMSKTEGGVTRRGEEDGEYIGASGEGEGRTASLTVSGSSKNTRVNGSVLFEEREVEDPVAAISLLADSNEFDLVVVGRGRRTTPLVAQIAAQRTPFRSYFHHSMGARSSGAGGTSAAGHSHHHHQGSERSSELGPVGELLVASESHCSVLVVQQFDPLLVRSLRGQGSVMASERLGITDAESAAATGGVAEPNEVADGAGSVAGSASAAARSSRNEAAEATELMEKDEEGIKGTNN